MVKYFLNNEKSMHQKYKDGEIRWSEYYSYFKSKPKYTSLMHQKHLSGEITRREYDDYCARQRGFRNRNDVASDYKHKKGIVHPMDENKYCSFFLGVHIAERILSKVFSNVIRMPINHLGYDFICNRGYKIDVKSACLGKNNSFSFNIRKNKITDYFLLLAFDNREDLNPMYMWLIKGDEKINETKLNDKIGIVIRASPKSLQKFLQYELNEKLKELNVCCNTLKNK